MVVFAVALKHKQKHLKHCFHQRTSHVCIVSRYDKLYVRSMRVGIEDWSFDAFINNSEVTAVNHTKRINRNLLR